MDTVERVQRSTTKMIKGLENLSSEERLKELGEEKAQGDLITVLQYLMGSYKEDRGSLFTRSHMMRTKGNGYKAAVNKHPQVLLCWAAFQPLFPKPVALHGVAVAQVQDLALGLVKPHTIDLGPSIQPVQVPLQSLPTLKQINTPAQLGVICKLAEGALNPFVQIIDKDAIRYKEYLFILIRT
ncbi:hypothetical protein QYF61_021088 [Mycteria americana]|uniref:Uncharacterized protein n=1 Tax=Mycteria americana TaxID=33587 RepID=A0AAN7SAW8_MYCAM|nr:hypothetical protein QYF61_021088 [Mycteria americana]